MACNLVVIYRCFGETCFLHVSESHDGIVEVNLIPSISDMVGSGQPHSLTSTVTNKVVHLFSEVTFWIYLDPYYCAEEAMYILWYCKLQSSIRNSTGSFYWYWRKAALIVETCSYENRWPNL